jgi:hypothetical protein
MQTERIVCCSIPGCGEPAEYKVAAPWRDDKFSGLKTYGFACSRHLESVLCHAEPRWLEYEAVAEETVEEIGIFRFEPGKGDRHLERDRELEAILCP